MAKVGREHGPAAAVETPGTSTPALQAWNALLDGAWVVVHVSERQGRRYLVARAVERGARGVREGLTARERVAIRSVAAGSPYKHVAAELGVSPATAGRIALRALQKLGIASRIELAALLGR